IELFFGESGRLTTTNGVEGRPGGRLEFRRDGYAWALLPRQSVMNWSAAGLFYFEPVDRQVVVASHKVNVLVMDAHRRILWRSDLVEIGACCFTKPSPMTDAYEDDLIFSGPAPLEVHAYGSAKPEEGPPPERIRFVVSLQLSNHPSPILSSAI